MKEIKCIIFDFGGVISTGHVDKCIQRMAEIIGVTRAFFLPSYFRYRNAYDQGLITVEMYWQEICKALEVQLNREMLEQLIPVDIDSWTTINKKTLTYVLEAKKKAGKVVLLSNINEETLTYLENKHDWMEIFDHKIYSCKLKMIKPDRAIYERTLETVGLKGEDCLFVDDSLPNIEGARACGVNAIHFTDYEAFIEEMEAHYILIADE